MTTQKSLIEEAEKNVVMQAKFFHELLSFMDHFSHNTAKKMNGSRENRELFVSGMDKAKTAIYNEMQLAFARCFAFVGVGGEEANKLSREYANELFSGKYCNMQWLETWYDVPGTWKIEDADQIQQELINAIKNNKKKDKQCK